MSRIGLRFLPNPSGDGEGLGDAGIETFRDRPFAAVARETGQNSRDARDNSEAPVRVAYDVMSVKAVDFPSIGEFRSAAQICLDKAVARNREKEIGFFRHAVKVLQQDEIQILRISDYNTRGVRGPCEEGRPFHALAKADGTGEKAEIDAGGSFGIGKNAAFALSDIQTSIVSTRYCEGGRDHMLCMGKTLFISHTGTDGEEKRRKGYWGKIDGYMPLDDPDEIPDWLKRDEQGTSIFSICMRAPRTDWRYEMTAAILMNFFCAIHRREMEFEIDEGSLKINRGTLQTFFHDPAVIEAVQQLNAVATFEAARILHTCLVDERTQVFPLEVPDLGRVTMRMLIRDGLGYTIGVVRNGMYITNNLGNFGEPFLRFPLHREFAVIVEPEGKVVGEWFRRLENPRHDDLSAERVVDPDLRERGQKLFTSLAKLIRSKIRELAKAEPTSSIELDELNEFFASEETRTDDEEGTETDPRSYVTKKIAKASTSRKPRAPYRGTEEDDLPGPVPGFGSGTRPTPPGPKPDPKPRSVAEPVLLENERNLMPDAGDPTRRRIMFTTPVDGPIAVAVDASGLSTPERLKIVSATVGIATNGLLGISCREGQRVSADVTFETAYSGPIELSAFRQSPAKEAAE